MSENQTILPEIKWDGYFESFDRWVKFATRELAGRNAVCFDMKGRICRIGADFHRARDEKAFPVFYKWHEPSM